MSALGKITRPAGRVNLLLVRPIWRQSAQTLSRPQVRHSSSRGASATARIDRVLSKLPRPLRRYADRLRNAPVSHVTAFLILHELTAVIPLLAFFCLFHYTNVGPLNYTLEHYGSYVTEGATRAERYLTKKGWLGFGTEKTANTASDALPKEQTLVTEVPTSDLQAVRSRILLEVGLAYAITKVLLPMRIVGSVWATPWAAGLFGHIRRLIRRPPG